MSLSSGGIKLARRLARQIDIPVAVLPAFLCPGILKTAPAPRSKRYCQHRHLHSTEASQKREVDFLTSHHLTSVLEPTLSPKLPVQCPGCGALSQVVEKDEPGFYTLSRRSVKGYFHGSAVAENDKEWKIFANSMSELEALQDVTEESKEIIGDLSSALAKTIGMD